MNIGGFQKTSLLDYPDCISSIIWTTECNFRCPFCYNKDLIIGKTQLIPEKGIIRFLEKRKKMIEAVVISGGEPLLQKDLLNFSEKIKKMGYLVKIDTNGTKPQLLKTLLDKQLIDYIAMDVKAPQKKYQKLCGIKPPLQQIEASIQLIKDNAPDYEFKTTMVPSYLKKEDIVAIGKWLQGSKKFFLQQFKNDVPLVLSTLQNIESYSKEYLLETLNAVKPYFEVCKLRGVT